MHHCACAQGTSCHHVSGDCGCPPGFKGNGCEQSECCRILFCLPAIWEMKCCRFYKVISINRFLSQLVSQEHLDRTVIRFAGARRQTSSATRCPGYATALQVSTAADVTKVQKIVPFISCRHIASQRGRGLLKVLILFLLLFSVCRKGRYGLNCESECQCENGGRCIPSTGACDCPAGFIGASCNISESI